MARKILIVDDQTDILLILEREFRRLAGMSVFTAKDYLTALSFVAEKQIDLVISDVRLGTASGFDLVREIKQTHPETGAILMTAYRSPSNRQMADDLGVVLFLEKPFQIPRLIQEVETYFRQRENPAPAETVAAAPSPAATAIEESSALVHFKLQDLVQLFCLNGRNILISVAPGPSHIPGEIYIQKGNVIHADYEGKTGDEGFQRMMQISSPILKVKDWAAPVPVTIKSSWMHLLLQSAVHDDHQPDQQASGLG